MKTSDSTLGTTCTILELRTCNSCGLCLWVFTLGVKTEPVASYSLCERIVALVRNVKQQYLNILLVGLVRMYYGYENALWEYTFSNYENAMVKISVFYWTVA